MKLEKDEFLKLYSDDITKKEYDRIISLVDARFDEIMRQIATHLDWYDYANGGHKDSDGYFDPDDYNEYIPFTGDLVVSEPFDYEIPTKWLWEDFEEEFKKEVFVLKNEQLQEKLKAKNKREELKIKKVEMKNLISQKLTKDELKFIKFK